MLMFLFGECFSPLIILDKMIKKKKTNCWRILYQEEGRWAGGGFYSHQAVPWGQVLWSQCCPGRGWAGTGCSDGVNSAWAWAGWGDTLLVPAGSGRTCRAGEAAKYTCEQGEGAEPCLKTQTYMKFLML